MNVLRDVKSGKVRLQRTRIRTLVGCESRWTAADEVLGELRVFFTLDGNKIASEDPLGAQLRLLSLLESSRGACVPHGACVASGANRDC